MPTLSRTVPEDIEGTIVRLLAYMGGLAVLSIAVAGFFRVPELVAAAPQPPPRPQWIEVERPHPAFDLVLPDHGGSPTHYAILRREADDARKDILTWGEAKGSGAYANVEIYRPGGAGERFIDAASEIAARIVDLTITDDVKPAGMLDSKFGPVALVDFAIAGRQGSAAASALPARSTILRCKSPAGIATPATRPSAGRRSPARSTGSPSFPPAATARSPNCSRAPRSSAPSAASAIRSWPRRPSVTIMSPVCG